MYFKGWEESMDFSYCAAVQKRGETGGGGGGEKHLLFPAVIKIRHK